MNTDDHDRQMDEIALDWLKTSDNKDTLALRYQCEQIIKRLQSRVDDLESEKASLVDILNTELRENGGGENAPQAGMRTDLRPYIRGLVDACKATHKSESRL